MFYNDGQISRRRNFDIYTAPSAYDDRKSLHLYYALHNDGLISNLHDEVRCLNDDLFLGLGSSSPIPTTFNSTPFIIVGPRMPLKASETTRN